MVDNNKKAGGPGEMSKARYLERVKDLDLEDLACRQKLVEVLGLKNLSHEDLSNHYLIVEPPNHQTSIARIRVAIPAQLRAVEKLPDPKSMGLPKTANIGPKLSKLPRYRRSHGTSQLAKLWQFKITRILERRELSSLRDLILMERPRSYSGRRRWCICYQGRS